jgi:sulfur transfer protein SufE
MFLKFIVGCESLLFLKIAGHEHKKITLFLAAESALFNGEFRAMP